MHNCAELSANLCVCAPRRLLGGHYSLSATKRWVAPHPVPLNVHPPLLNDCRHPLNTDHDEDSHVNLHAKTYGT